MARSVIGTGPKCYFIGAFCVVILQESTATAKLLSAGFQLYVLYLLAVLMGACGFFLKEGKI